MKKNETEEKWIKNTFYALLSSWLPLETFMLSCEASKQLLKGIFPIESARFFLSNVYI